APGRRRRRRRGRRRARPGGASARLERAARAGRGGRWSWERDGGCGGGGGDGGDADDALHPLRLLRAPHPLGSEFAAEPGARHRPVVRDGAVRDAQRLGRLLEREPGEVAALDDADPAGALLGEAFERVVYREELLQGYVGLGGVAGEGEADVLAAALVGALLPGVVHQHAAHGRGGGAEEVGAALPADVLVADEAEVGLVDEPRRVEGVAGALVAQPGARHLAELLVDRREEPVE